MNGSFQHILLPCDLSEEEAAACKTALDLAQRERARVTVLHVIELLRDIPFEELKGFYGVLEARAERRLEGVTAQFRTAGIECTSQVRFGDRVREILGAASDLRADLLVMRGRGANENGSSAINRIGYRTALLSRISVLIVNASGG